jgi:hypothetical protein
MALNLARTFGSFPELGDRIVSVLIMNQVTEPWRGEHRVFSEGQSLDCENDPVSGEECFMRKICQIVNFLLKMITVEITSMTGYL